ncbi:MAG: protein kinase [Gammaproteobacteria bacterium]|nr:protein kinase [Gammaproteobacteria bacterium]
MIGRSISNFEIIEKLGSGGMGVVYLARDTRLNRPAALKFLPPHMATDEDAKARFMQEAQAASGLDHPNICSIYQIGETDDGELFIAMAHYEGQTLKYRLDEEDFSVERALKIGRQLAAGLSCAHEAGIVHRDIKPANIMVTDRGEVKILDFGLAKLTTGAQLTKSGSTLGTAAYMSPEQYRGEEVGPSADVWSLGIVLYEMVTGKPPFAGDYEQAVMYSVLNAEPDAVADLTPGVPDDFAAFIMRCLDKDFASRPSMKELSGDPLESTPGVSSSGSSVVTPADPRRERVGISKRTIGIAVAAVVALIAAAGLWGLRSDPEVEVQAPVGTSDGAIRVAVLPFTVRGSPDIEYLGQGMVDILATKLDGAGNWRSVDPRAILGSLGGVGSSIDPSAGEKVAAKVGADRFILGSIIEVGGTLQVRASVYSSAGDREPIASGSAEGPADELFSMVDELAAQLLVAEDENPGDRVIRLAAVTTESLPALKSYLEGEAEFRAGRYRTALEAFRTATELDSMFALAWYRLSVAAEWNAQGRLGTEAAVQARRLSARLSAHDRDLLDAFDVFRQGDARKAEQMYRTIVAVYPEDVEAWFQLGEVLAHQFPLFGQSAAFSREAWERVLFFEPDHLQALWHLYRIPALLGDVAEMDSLVQRIIELNPDGDRLVEIYALQAAVHGDEEMMSEAFRSMEGASEGAVALAGHAVAVQSGWPPDAIPFARYMARPGFSTEQRVLGYLWLSYLEASAGRIGLANSAMAEALQVSRDSALPYEGFLLALPFFPKNEQAIARMITRLETWDARAVPRGSNPQSWHVVHEDFHENLRLYLLGLLSAQTGETEKAELYAAEYETVESRPSLGSTGADLALSLQANIALNAGRSDEALTLLLRQKGYTWYNLLFASPFVSQVRDRFVKAELLRDAGRYEEAIQYYRSFAENSAFDTVFNAPAHRRMGEVYEKLGDPEEAATHYRRFIQLWEDADAELQPMVDDARQRLATLEVELTG